MANVATELVVQSFPCSLALPFGEVVVADAPWRQVVGHHPPCDAASNEIEDPVEHAPLAVAGWTPHLGRTRYQGFDYAPVLVGEITVVAFVFHRLPTMGRNSEKAPTK